MKTTIVLALLSAVAAPAMAMDHHGTVQADGLTWTAPAAYAPGAQLARVIRQVADGVRYIDPQLAADALAAEECPLTPRELETLRAAADGAPVSRIARSLGLSEGTVRNYLSAAVTKLGADNRHAAVRAARDAGWL